MHSSSKFLYFSISQLSALSFALFTLLCLNASPVSAQMKIGSNPTSMTDLPNTNLEIEGNGGIKTIFLKNGNVGIGTTSPTQRLNVANTSGQWDVPLWVGPSSHATSRRTGITMDDWSWMQDANGNGTKDFFLWQGSAATSRINFSTTGNVGIGTSASSLIRLYTHYSNTNLAGPSYGTYTHADAIATTNGTYYARATMAIARPTISTGVTNSGWAIAAGFQAMRTNGTDLGTLSNLYGMDVTYGHNSNVGAAAVTTNAYGMVITPYAQVGTIANMYDLFLAGTQTGGTLTNHYALYQADANSKNYFAGNVGIGTTSPTSLIHVNNPSTSNTATTQMLLQQSGIANLNASLRLTAQSSGDLFRTSIVNNGTEHLTVTSSGNVGIGTTSPVTKLGIIGAMSFDGYAGRNIQVVNSPLDANDKWMVFQNSYGGNTTGAFDFQIYPNSLGVSGTSLMTIRSNGNVGIGTTGPTAKLDVTTSGTQIAFRSITSSATGYASLMHNTASNYYCYVGYLNTYSIVCSGPTSLPSDMRLKKDITPLTDISGLTAIMNLRPISYTWKDTKKGSRTEYGFVAQEVEKVFPNLVGSLAPTTDEEKAQTGGAPMKTLQYEGFIAPLVKSVQELKAENDALKVRVSRLESLLTNK